METALVDKNGNALRSSRSRELSTIKRIPDYATLVNEGKVFEFLETTTTVALVARPTTLSNLTFQNPPGSGKIYVVFGLKIYTDVVGAGLGTVSVWHCVHKLKPVTDFTRDLVLAGTGAGSATCLKGGTSYNGQAIVDRGATVIDDGWVPTELSLVSNIATTNFQANAAKLSMPVILPEGIPYSLQTTATVVTYESALGITWAELDEDDLIYV